MPRARRTEYDTTPPRIVRPGRLARTNTPNQPNINGNAGNVTENSSFTNPPTSVSYSSINGTLTDTIKTDPAKSVQLGDGASLGIGTAAILVPFEVGASAGVTAERVDLVPEFPKSKTSCLLSSGSEEIEVKRQSNEVLSKSKDWSPYPRGPVLSAEGSSSKGGVRGISDGTVLKPGSLTGLLAHWGCKSDGLSAMSFTPNAAFSPSWAQMIDKAGFLKPDSVSADESSKTPADELRHFKELFTRERVSRIVVEQQLQEERTRSQELQQEFDQQQEEKQAEHDARVELEQRVQELTRRLEEKELSVNELEVTLSIAQHSLEEYRQSEPCDWVLDRHEIILTDNVIGVGAWGRVLEGSFRKCTVAIKQIHDLILSPHNRRLFEREMDIASRCRHPCLLQFIGATNDDLSPLFVTELLDTSLRAILHERALAPTEIKTLSLDVGQALNYLHENKPTAIIHRDISSANVLLWKHHDVWRAKVSDYGTANFMHHSMTVSPGAVVYSPPEAHTSRQSPKLDVYSFGVLLCEMNMREFPDPQHRQEQVALVTSHLFRDLIRRCLQEDCERRPSMGDVIDAILVIQI